MKPAQFSTSRSTGLLVLGFALAWTSGCTTPPPIQEDPVIQSFVVEDFAANVPIDVAVLPVVNRSARSLPILSLVRKNSVSELTDRWYSPIALNYVDAEVGSHPRTTPYDIDRYRNRMDEDAILAITVTEFDTSYLLAYRKVRVGGSFELYNSADGQLLWSRSIQKKWIEVPGNIEPGAIRTAERTGVREFVKFAFEDLPRRSVVSDKRP